MSEHDTEQPEAPDTVDVPVEKPQTETTTTEVEATPETVGTEVPDTTTEGEDSEA